MPFCLDAKDAETAALVVEGDALYDAGNLIGRGSPFWHGGVHVGIILPRRAGAWGDLLGVDSAGIWLLGGGSGRLQRLTGVAAILGQPNARPAWISSNPAANVSPEFSEERRVMEFLYVVRVPQAGISDRALTGL
jgi:hypothetical protein